MPIVITHASLFDLDPPGIRPGGLRIEGGMIAEACASPAAHPGDEVLDAGGCVVMPGLVNGHTHLYSALAVGMPAPPRVPRDFHEILELIWWRLDRALDAESIEVSGVAGALDALRCGTTTLIDHHASPNCIAGSLDALERGIAAVGLRGVLCYETTERNRGAAEAGAGLEENERYLLRCAAGREGRFAGLVGAHAAFTLSDDSLRACARLAEAQRSGVHIHVAEDPCDDRLCRERYGRALLERLESCGVIQSGALLAHATHLGAEDARRIGGRVAGVAHNPRSNMNNRVGYAPVGALHNVLLGTDGIGSDMFTEARHAWFKSRDARLDLSPADIASMLARAARVAGGRLGIRLGRLEAGAAADVVITDYLPATPLDSGNAAGHLLFGLGPQHVRHVLIGGRFALKDRQAVNCDENELRRAAARVARSLWERMADL
jgi:putative selenium metabolism protein SsnA